MAARKSGSIINISSISALRPRGLTPYSASKGAVIALTRAMAVDHGKDGIRVNCIAPGPMYTPMVYSRGMSAELRERRRKASLLGIEGTGWDIGYAALFLASDEPVTSPAWSFRWTEEPSSPAPRGVDQR
jgi:NAD(P)-dependent dehydrogenase (short-subunit alcohol dehydrogenase family)